MCFLYFYWDIVYELKIKVTHPMSNTPMDSFTGTFHRDCVLVRSTNTKGTILAGRPAVSPKAPKVSRVKGCVYYRLLKMLQCHGSSHLNLFFM